MLITAVVRITHHPLQLLYLTTSFLASIKVRHSSCSTFVAFFQTFSEVPERFADHILVSDAVVGQGLTPHRVESVVQGLGSEFIGLKDKHKSRLLNRTEAGDWLPGFGRAHHPGCQFWWRADGFTQASLSIQRRSALVGNLSMHWRPTASARKHRLAAAYWTAWRINDQQWTVFTWRDRNNRRRKHGDVTGRSVTRSSKFF